MSKEQEKVAPFVLTTLVPILLSLYILSFFGKTVSLVQKSLANPVSNILWHKNNLNHCSGMNKCCLKNKIKRCSIRADYIWSKFKLLLCLSFSGKIGLCIQISKLNPVSNILWYQQNCFNHYYCRMIASCLMDKKGCSTHLDYICSNFKDSLICFPLSHNNWFNVKNQHQILFQIFFGTRTALTIIREWF